MGGHYSTEWNGAGSYHTIERMACKHHTALCVELLKLLGVILVLMLVYILVEVQT